MVLQRLYDDLDFDHTGAFEGGLLRWQHTKLTPRQHLRNGEVRKRASKLSRDPTFIGSIA